MGTNRDFVSWLSRKLYEVNIGFYLTIALVMTLPYVFGLVGLPAFAARFIAFFIISFVRAGYESLVVYESPLNKLSFPKMLLLSFITAGVLSLFAHYLRPQLGAFAIPVSLVISMLVVGKIKARLWKPSKHAGFGDLLPAKLTLMTWGRYSFFAILVGITYGLYGRLDINFLVAFALAYFVAMLVEELYSAKYVYEQSITVKMVIATIVWSVVCAALSAVMIFVAMNTLGYSGQIVTIASVLIVKLIQPLGSRACILAS